MTSYLNAGGKLFLVGPSQGRVAAVFTHDPNSPAGTPLRFATLDAYDGAVWGASNRANNGTRVAGAAFQQVGIGGVHEDERRRIGLSGVISVAVPVTSRYGWYYGGYPFNNNPGDTNPHHFYDETRAMFGSTQPAGLPASRSFLASP